MNNTVRAVLMLGALALAGFAGTRIQNYRLNSHFAKVREECRQYVKDLVTTSKTPVGVPDSVSGKLKLFILAGQSNMSGRGELIGSDSVLVHDRAYLLGNDFRWRRASEPVDSPVGQVDVVSLDDNAGFGPGLAFASYLLDGDASLNIGLIPVARGGTSIHQWRRSLSDTSLYGAFLKRVKAATVMGDLAGFLWHQGEADARPANDAERRPLGPSWNDGFEEFIENVRTDLQVSGLPVIYAQIGTHQNPSAYPRWEEVKKSQLNVGLDSCALITTSDLDLMDRVHLTRESYSELGRRYARAYLRLTTDGSPTGRCINLGTAE